MKRFLIMTAVFLLGACSAGGTPAGSMPAASAAPESSSAPSAEPSSQPSAEGNSEKLDDMIGYLCGDWTLRTNDPKTDGCASIHIDDHGNAIISANGDWVMTAALELFDSEPDSGMKGDAIRFGVYDAADVMVEEYGDSFIIYSSDMQYLTGSYEKLDYLFLRELGNGLSVIDASIFKEENMTGDHGWVFTRERADVFAPAAGSSMEPGSHYMFCWMKNGETCYLQNVETLEEPLDMYGEVIQTIRFHSPVNRAILVFGQSAGSGFYAPGLYQVEIDADGAVAGMKQLEYIGYGAHKTAG